MHYLRNQTAKIIWNDASGDSHLVDTGLRQGVILSPLLFKLYLDYLISDIGDMDIGCRFGFIRVNILAYADDIVILSDSCEDLEKVYLRLVEHIKNLKLSMNKTKSECMIFDMSRYGDQTREIKLVEDVLENVKCHKYFGHYIQRDLLGIKDVEHQLNLIYAKFNSTYKKFKNVY